MYPDSIFLGFWANHTHEKLVSKVLIFATPALKILTYLKIGSSPHTKPYMFLKAYQESFKNNIGFALGTGAVFEIFMFFWISLYNIGNI